MTDNIPVNEHEHVLICPDCDKTPSELGYILPVNEEAHQEYIKQKKFLQDNPLPVNECHYCGAETKPFESVMMCTNLYCCNWTKRGYTPPVNEPNRLWCDKCKKILKNGKPCDCPVNEPNELDKILGNEDITILWNEGDHVFNAQEHLKQAIEALIAKEVEKAGKQGQIYELLTLSRVREFANHPYIQSRLATLTTDKEAK